MNELFRPTKSGVCINNQEDLDRLIAYVNVDVARKNNYTGPIDLDQ